MASTCFVRPFDPSLNACPLGITYHVTSDRPLFMSPLNSHPVNTPLSPCRQRQPKCPLLPAFEPFSDFAFPRSSSSSSTKASSASRNKNHTPSNTTTASSSPRKARHQRSAAIAMPAKLASTFCQPPVPAIPAAFMASASASASTPTPSITIKTTDLSQPISSSKRSPSSASSTSSCPTLTPSRPSYSRSSSNDSVLSHSSTTPISEYNDSPASSLSIFPSVPKNGYTFPPVHDPTVYGSSLDSLGSSNEDDDDFWHCVGEGKEYLHPPQHQYQHKQPRDSVLSVVSSGFDAEDVIDLYSNLFEHPVMTAWPLDE